MGFQPQLYADNLKCVSRDPGLLLHAARFTTGYVGLVGQEPAPRKCVLLSTSGEVRKDMKDWVLSLDGDKWSVKFDVRDLGGHLDTTFRVWSSTLAARVSLVISRLALLFILPLDFHGRVRVVRSMYIPAALHGIEASLLASDSLRKLRSSIRGVVWSRRQPMANVGAVLSLLDGPTGCDPAFCVVWFRFRLLRRYLALWLAEVGIPKLWLGLGLVYLFLVTWLVLFSISRLLSLMLGATRFLLTSVVEREMSMAPCSFSILLMLEEEIRPCFAASWLGVSGMVFFLVRFVIRLFLVGSAVLLMGMVTCSGNVPFLFLVRFVKILSFMISWEWIRSIGRGVCFGMVGFLSCPVLTVPLLRLLVLLIVLVTLLNLHLVATLFVFVLNGVPLMSMMKLRLLL